MHTTQLDADKSRLHNHSIYLADELGDMAQSMSLTNHKLWLQSYLISSRSKMWASLRLCLTQNKKAPLWRWWDATEAIQDWIVANGRLCLWCNAALAHSRRLLVLERQLYCTVNNRLGCGLATGGALEPCVKFTPLLQRGTSKLGSHLH